MKVKIGRTTYEVEFTHSRLNGMARNKFGKLWSYAGRTLCRIVSFGRPGARLGGKEKSFGIAYQNPQDEYNKECGRKVSLARALKLFPKKDRKKFWEAYLTRGRGEYIK